MPYGLWDSGHDWRAKPTKPQQEAECANEPPPSPLGGGTMPAHCCRTATRTNDYCVAKFQGLRVALRGLGSSHAHQT